MARGLRGGSECRARRPGPQPSHRDTRNDELVGGAQRRRERRGVEVAELALGFPETPDQEQAADLEIARMGGIQAVAMGFQRRPRGVEGFGGPGEVARDQRDLGFRNHASRPRHRLARAEGARRVLQQRLRANEVAKLRHRDAAQRERRRVVAQGHPFQRAEGVTDCERTRRRRDQRVH